MKHHTNNKPATKEKPATKAKLATKAKTGAKSQKAQPKPVESGCPKAKYPKMGINAIGEQVSKHFGEHGTYIGTVVAVSPNSLECLCLSDEMYAIRYTDETYTIRYTDGDEDDMHLEQYIEAWNLWASISSLGLAQPLKVGDEICVDWCATEKEEKPAYVKAYIS